MRHLLALLPVMIAASAATMVQARQPEPAGPARPDNGAIAKALDSSITQNAQNWLFNRYDAGSLGNVAIVETPDRDTMIVRATYTFNGGQQGSVTARIIRGTVQCLQYWDRNFCETVADVAPEPQQESDTSASRPENAPAQQGLPAP